MQTSYILVNIAGKKMSFNKQNKNLLGYFYWNFVAY